MDEWDADGLPDAAFTEDELAAGVQHIARTGNPNATSSRPRPKSQVRKPGNDQTFSATERAKPVEPSLYDPTTLHFETFDQARKWAIANPGSAFRKAKNGLGFEAAPLQQHFESIHGINDNDSLRRRLRALEVLVPHLHDVLSNSGSIQGGRVNMRPFNENTWQSELSRLNQAQLQHLGLVVSIHLKDTKIFLDFTLNQIKHHRRMKSGNYGEALFEKIIVVMEKAIVDIHSKLAHANT